MNNLSYVTSYTELFMKIPFGYIFLQTFVCRPVNHYLTHCQLCHAVRRCHGSVSPSVTLARESQLNGSRYRIILRLQ